MKLKSKRKNDGITLVALVITIIIVLILATISIQSLTNTGLFKKAQEAKEKSQNAEENQVKTLNEYEEELNKYISKEKEENEDKLADTVKVGDYVSYTPDTVTDTDTKYTTLISNLGKYSGSDANTTSTLKQEKDLKWRVLDVQNGQVRLISEVPTSSTITLKGYNGYNNAVKLLDDTCNTLYDNSKLASKVQNLKIEDITKFMNAKPTEDTTEYAPTNKYYPSILLKEKEQTVNGTTGTELGVSEQKEFINQTEKIQANSWRVKKTYYYKTLDKSNSFTDTKYYELFINNGNNYPVYWMSSRCINTSSTNVSYLIRYVNSGYIGANDTYYSDLREAPGNYAFRPVITLNSNVQIDTANSRNGSTAEQAYIIK